MADTLPGFEHSPLCGKVTRDNETVDVRIYRLANGEAAWSLEVIDADGGSTVWDDLFDTDQAAYAEFSITVEREGIACFREAPADLHWN